MVPQVDFSTLGDLPQVYRQAQVQRGREMTLADLGRGGITHEQAAQRLIASGDMQGGMALANLANAQQDRALKERQVKLQEYAAMDKPSVAWQDGVPYRVAPGAASVTRLPVEGQGDLNEGVPPHVAALGQSAVKAWKENRVKQISNIDDKAVTELDNNVRAGEASARTIGGMLELNKTAYAGPTAGIRGYIGSQIGIKAAEDTEVLSNETIKGAVEQLRTAFGGNPTEGERKILIDLQGSINKSQEVRRRIFENALAEVNRRTEYGRKTADEMRSGTYLLPQAQRAKFDAGSGASAANTAAQGGGYYTGGGGVAPGPGYYPAGQAQPQAAPQQQAPAFPPEAAAALKSNPSRRDEFDAKYGAGAAAMVLGR